MRTVTRELRVRAKDSGLCRDFILVTIIDGIIYTLLLLQGSPGMEISIFFALSPLLTKVPRHCVLIFCRLGGQFVQQIFRLAPLRYSSIQYTWTGTQVHNDCILTG